MKFRLFKLSVRVGLIDGLLLGLVLLRDIVCLNVGPVCFYFYLAPSESPVCSICGRSLRWGLHGSLFGRFRLCRKRR